MARRRSMTLALVRDISSSAPIISLFLCKSQTLRQFADDPRETARLLRRHLRARFAGGFSYRRATHHHPKQNLCSACAEKRNPPSAIIPHRRKRWQN